MRVGSWMLSAGAALGMWLVALAAAEAQVSPPAPGNLLCLERMGAGAPGGWRVDGANYAWESESEPGPLGVGAARIRFEGSGCLMLDSPARKMRAGAGHAAGLWIRSDPPGASVHIEVSDNDWKTYLETEAVAAESWQHVSLQGELPKAVKGRYYLTLDARGNDCTLWMDGLWLGECEGPVGPDWNPPVHPASVTLEPVAGWGVVTGANPMQVKACVVGVTRKNCRLELRAVHTNGATADLPPIALDDSGAWRGTFEAAGEIAKPFGMLRVEAVVKDPDGKALSPMTETLLARAPEPVPGPLPASFFGVHVGLRDPDAEAVAKLGYKWCRIHDADRSTKWGIAEPEPGKWMWFDDEVALPGKHGLRILGLLDGSPPWESGTKKTGYFSIYHAPRSIDNWRNYVRQVVTHYAGAIDDWEVWNEPWDMARFFAGGTPKLYAQLLQAAYEEAKAANPECTVVGIDTYPPFWEKAVLALGAYPHYDVLSWHRYDPALLGRPDDSIALVAQRIRDAQATYGAPKPLLCSEGGTDVTPFHGSFFSFADPGIMGDWSLGADRYARMFLSTIAAGNQRFIAYSVHNHPRHGLPTHMLIEPNYLLRPMHLTLAALAHFIDGSRFEERLAPAHDISALVFSQPDARLWAKGPSTVVVLYANGPEPEDLPKTIPTGIRCFDRWANPIDAPSQAARGLVYLVAADDAKAELLDALRTDGEVPSSGGDARDLEPLLKSTVASLTGDGPPLWQLFSAQGSLAVMGTPDGHAAARRQDLRSEHDLAAPFALPAGTEIDGHSVKHAGRFTLGLMHLANGTLEWTATFCAVPDGPGGSWRYVTLTIVPKSGDGAPADRQRVVDRIKPWERSLLDAHTRGLHGRFHEGPCLVTASLFNGEYFVFDNPEDLISMLDTALVFGPAQVSSMSLPTVEIGGGVAVVFGQWHIMSLAFGAAPYAVTATLIASGDGWRVASMCVSAG